eukprot:2142567-Alexandrium_andersonii.AAC.1
MLATHPCRLVTKSGNCDIDATGWVLAASFFRCASQLCGSDALRAACSALTQIGKMDTGTWEGAVLVLAFICCPKAQVLAARELGAEDDCDYGGQPKGWVGEHVGSADERRRRARRAQELPPDPLSDIQRRRGSRV